VKHDNVVPFDPARRGGSARRGAPDKREKAAPGVVALQCPTCASSLRLEPEWLDDDVDLLCGGCETEIPLARAPEGALGF